MKKGKLIVFSAPSGSGKTTIVRHLLAQDDLNLEFSISAATRDPRGEDALRFRATGARHRTDEAPVARGADPARYPRPRPAVGQQLRAMCSVAAEPRAVLRREHF